MLHMPAVDEKTIQRRAIIASDLRKILPYESVIEDEAARRPYESDGLTAYRNLPLLVVLPQTTQEVSQILSYCYKNEIKVVPRGSGTSLSGGALPLQDGILLGLAKFNKILSIDLDNRLAVVQPGVTNQSITKAVEQDGFYFAPDPSSQIACSIGGNVAENSGGVHCLKYGVTTNNLLGLELVTIEGEIIQIGGMAEDSAGYDLLGLLTGSEGLLGVITSVTVKLLPTPEAAQAILMGFPSVEAGGACVAAIISAGIIPAGLEMMDNFAINAAEDFINANYPRNVEAMLICELDGHPSEIVALLDRVEKIAKLHQASHIQRSSNEDERKLFWAGRKAAFPAIGRLTPDYYCMDGTIPRYRLPEVLKKMQVLSEHYGLRVANVFHAGDGNLHPLIMYDANQDDELERAEAFGSDILKLCVAVGGVLTGEHGVGVEKRDLMGEMFNQQDLNYQQWVKCAFDEKGLLNPGKMFPILHRCAELGQMHVHNGELPFKDIPRF